MWFDIISIAILLLLLGLTIAANPRSDIDALTDKFRDHRATTERRLMALEYRAAKPVDFREDMLTVTSPFTGQLSMPIRGELSGVTSPKRLDVTSQARAGAPMVHSGIGYAAARAAQAVQSKCCGNYAACGSKRCYDQSYGR